MEQVLVIPFGGPVFEGLGNDNPVIPSHEFVFLVGMPERLVDVCCLVLGLQSLLQLLVLSLHFG
jgi:hypothetical protein